MTKLEQVKHHVRGPVMPIITIYRDDLSLDLDAIQDNVRFLVERGVVKGRGVMLSAGAGGDFPMLSPEERKQVSRAIVDAADGEAVVVVGCQDTDPRVCRALADYAQEIGAYGIQVSPPYYYYPSDADVIAFFQALNDAVSCPIMVYNTPWLVGYDMSTEVLDALADMRWILSLKWATSNVTAYSRRLARYADRLAIIDNAGMPVWARMLGATGFITHLANIWPQHDLALWAQLERGEYAAAQTEYQRVNWPWLDFRIKMGQVTGGEANVVKAAYDLIGRRGGPVRPPTRDMGPEDRAVLCTILRTIGVPGP